MPPHAVSSARIGGTPSLLTARKQRGTSGRETQARVPDLERLMGHASASAAHDPPKFLAVKSCNSPPKQGLNFYKTVLQQLQSSNKQGSYTNGGNES